MNIKDIEGISLIKLDSTTSFENVVVDDLYTVKYCDEGVAEVNLYIANLTNVKSVNDFIAAYLKLLYIDLFEGEADEELNDAYSNIVSKYKLDIQTTDKKQLLDSVASYLSLEDLHSLEVEINDVSIVYRCHPRQDIYLLASNERLFLIECEHE